VKAYLDLLRQIMKEGVDRGDRTGVGTRSLFSLQFRHKMSEGFPAVTTKQLVWKSMVSELLWFISGSNNIYNLKRIYPHNRLWDANYEDYLKRLGISENDGSMGRTYGIQWRAWRGEGESTVDQLAEAIQTIQTNPDSRRILVNAWNAAEVGPQDVALPPCHSFFQFYVSGENLSLGMYQRSCDMFLGVPLNIASYALLLHMVAVITNLIPYELVITFGDAHIYQNHFEVVEEQLSRKPYTMPTLWVKIIPESIDEFEMDDFELVNYHHHPRLKAMMAV